MADSKYIDLDSALPRLANNEALYRKLVAKFGASIDIAAFDAALSARDYAQLGEIVHAAKGVAGNLSLAAFFDNSTELMDQLRDGGEPAEENIDAFKNLYYETVRAIDDYLA